VENDNDDDDDDVVALLALMALTLHWWTMMMMMMMSWLSRLLWLKPYIVRVFDTPSFFMVEIIFLNPQKNYFQL
jgi:hypothetical protein